jgi:glyoxylase-like metal-dependent hydrolase (beta-lactamase superfamily II)
VTRRWLLTFAFGLSLLPAGVAWAGEAPPQIQAAAAALGAANLQTIEFTGRGSDFWWGQAYNGASPWPRFAVPYYSVTIDYAHSQFRDDRRRAQVANPPLGGGLQPVIGELRQTWLLNNGIAWDLNGETPVPPRQNAARRPEFDIKSAVESRTAQIYLTPHGFIKAALAGGATVRVDEVLGVKKTHLTITTPEKAKFEAVLNPQNLIEHIQTTLSHPVIGDYVYEADFSDYKDFGGVRFPTRIVQRADGWAVLDVSIYDVKTNIPVRFDVPPAIRQAFDAPSPPAPLVPQKVAEGVWAVQGVVKSVIVEFRDYVIVVEAGTDEGRSIAVMEATKKLIPNKPIRYVINSHLHFDHSGGLRTYAAEGATIVTHEGNIPYYEQVWARPRTMVPDRLSRSGRKPAFEGVHGFRTFTDGVQRLSVYHYPRNFHAEGMMMVYLPNARIVIEADSFNGVTGDADSHTALANTIEFYDAVRELRIPVDNIVPLHGPVSVTWSSLERTVELFRDLQTFRAN